MLIIAANRGRVPYQAPPEPEFDDPSVLGPYTVDSYDSGFSTTGLNSTNPGRIYYPTDKAGTLPAFIFVPGLNASYTVEPYQPNISGTVRTQYDPVSILHLVATHGFVGMAIDPPSLSNDPTARATALVSARTSLAAEHSRSGSPLEGKLQTTNIALGGHSFGGAGAMRVSDLGASTAWLKAVIALEPVNNGGGPYSDVTVPTLVVAGEGSGLYSDDYADLGSITKCFAEIDANGQFDDMHDSPTAPIGALWVSDGDGLPGGSTTTAHTVDAILTTLLVSWLKVYLDGNTAYSSSIATGAGLSSFAYVP